MVVNLVLLFPTTFQNPLFHQDWKKDCMILSDRTFFWKGSFSRKNFEEDFFLHIDLNFFWLNKIQTCVYTDIAYDQWKWLLQYVFLRCLHGFFFLPPSHPILPSEFYHKMFKCIWWAQYKYFLLVCASCHYKGLNILKNINDLKCLCRCPKTFFFPKSMFIKLIKILLTLYIDKILGFSCIQVKYLYWAENLCMQSAIWFARDSLIQSWTIEN